MLCVVVSNIWVYTIILYICGDVSRSYFFQSERSADMFHDDIFGESPAANQKVVCKLNYLAILRLLTLPYSNRSLNF